MYFANKKHTQIRSIIVAWFPLANYKRVMPKIMIFSRKSYGYLCYFEHKVMIFYTKLIILVPVEGLRMGAHTMYF